MNSLASYLDMNMSLTQEDNDDAAAAATRKMGLKAAPYGQLMTEREFVRYFT